MLLDQTLTGMRELRIPDGVEWELLVVNNNCTDDTDEVIAHQSERLPIRRLYEPKPGLSNARNCAIAAATGELILWTDDDVLVDPGWLAAYVEAARRWPEAAYFGGEITPWYEAPPPRWVEENMDLLHGMLVVRRLGEEERVFAEGDSPSGLPYGANMAFRRHVLGRYPFDSRFGSVGNRKIFGDETTLLTHLHSLGLQGVWAPSAKVRHYIPKERATVRYMKYYFHWHGRTLALLEGVPEGRLLWGAPCHLYRRRWALLRNYYVAQLLGRPTWVATCIKAARIGGMIDEARDQITASAARAGVGAMEVS